MILTVNSVRVNQCHLKLRFNDDFTLIRWDESGITGGALHQRREAGKRVFAEETLIAVGTQVNRNVN